MAGYTRQAAANIVTGGVIDAADFNSEYNAIEAAFNGSTGHSHDGTAGNGPPISNLGPSNDFVVTSSVVRPKTDDTYDLGTSTIEWKDGFFDGTLRTDILTVDETSTFTGNVTTVADVAIGGNLTVTGNATISGNLTFGDADTDSINLAAEIDSHVIPNTDATYDLGSATKEWRNLHIDGTANIDSLVADTADINGGSIDGTVIGANSTAAISATTINASNTITGNVTGNLTGNAATATKLATARTVAVTGAVTGSTTFDGSGNVSITTTATADPQLTLQGDVTGNATFTNLGNASLNASLAANSVGTNEIETGGVGTSEIAGSAVTNAKLAANAVDTTELVNDSVTNAKIAANAVDTTEIANDAVTAAKIAANAVGSSEIATNAVGASEIAANAVNASELNVSGNGTSAQFLRSDGDGTFTWATPTFTDTNTTYTADGNYGMTLSGTAFRLEDDRRRNSTTADIKSGNTHDYTFYDADVGIRWYTAAAEEMRLENDGDLHVDGDVVAFSTTISDQRLKHNIEKIDSALDKVSKLGGYTFSYNKDGRRSAGVLAQEVEKVLPSAVESKSLVFEGEKDVEYKTVQYDQLHGLLIEAIKELKEQLDNCKKCECD